MDCDLCLTGSGGCRAAPNFSQHRLNKNTLEIDPVNVPISYPLYKDEREKDIDYRQ